SPCRPSPTATSTPSRGAATAARRRWPPPMPPDPLADFGAGVPALRNTETPRIFVAATRQDDGKTTTCLGLFAALQKRFPRIGYIKPVGQRFVDVEGAKIDEDTVLINDTYRPNPPIRSMSPIAVEPDFTRRYLSGNF